MNIFIYMNNLKIMIKYIRNYIMKKVYPLGNVRI
jgi:hypothetical protein